MNRIERKSNLELLKIIAIGLIIITHSTPDYAEFDSPVFISFNQTTGNIQELILTIFKIF